LHQSRPFRAAVILPVKGPPGLGGDYPTDTAAV